MIEFQSMIQSLSSRDESFQESVLVIELETGTLQMIGGTAPIVNYWDNELEMF